MQKASSQLNSIDDELKSFFLNDLNFTKLSRVYSHCSPLEDPFRGPQFLQDPSSERTHELNYVETHLPNQLQYGIVIGHENRAAQLDRPNPWAHQATAAETCHTGPPPALLLKGPRNHHVASFSLARNTVHTLDTRSD